MDPQAQTSNGWWRFNENNSEKTNLQAAGKLQKQEQNWNQEREEHNGG